MAGSPTQHRGRHRSHEHGYRRHPCHLGIFRAPCKRRIRKVVTYQLSVISFLLPTDNFLEGKPMKYRIGLWMLLGLLLVASVASAQEVESVTGEFNGPGTYTIGFMVQDAERHVRIRIPQRYDPDEATPLVFVLHGAGGTGTGIANWSGFDDLAEEEGFIAVYPDGVNRG